MHLYHKAHSLYNGEKSANHILFLPLKFQRKNRERKKNKKMNMNNLLTFISADLLFS